LLAALAQGQSPDPSPDPIAGKLEQAKKAYKQEVEKSKAIIQKAFDEADESARDAANVDLVKSIKAERAEFEATGKLPKRLAVAEYTKQRDKIRKDLSDAYTLAIRDYLKARKDDLAEKIKDERDAFQKDRPGAIPENQNAVVVMPDEFGASKPGQDSEQVRGVKVKVGDPQFTLLWDTKADIDLHVIEPGGKEIFWNDPKGRLGGELDVDNVEGFGPENIYWMKQNPDGSRTPGTGPPGEYRWFVTYYGGNLGVPIQTRWKVRVKHEGKVEIFQGVLSTPGARSRSYTVPVGP
jgi:uncharacterized protein YfaP (DUF2135 family)